MEENSEQIKENKEDNPEEKNSEENENQISLLEKWENQMNIIQEMTGIKGIFVIWGLIIVILFVYFNIFDSIITNLVGTLYPAFWTIKSLEKKSTEEQKKWLTYWVVFGSFIIVDMGSPVIMKFIPFYFLIKILFLMWLFMPGSNGCTIVYYLVVKKIFKYYEDKIDTYVDGAKEYANDMFNENNLKSFKNKKSFGKKYLSLDSKKNMKEDKEIDDDIDNIENNKKKEHYD
jgi:receptor expression-enhancing protein 5/6